MLDKILLRGALSFTPTSSGGAGALPVPAQIPKFSNGTRTPPIASARNPNFRPRSSCPVSPCLPHIGGGYAQPLFIARILAGVCITRGGRTLQAVGGSPSELMRYANVWTARRPPC